MCVHSCFIDELVSVRVCIIGKLVSIVHVLNIGYTNGKMEFLHWNQIETNLTPEYFKIPRPLITLWPLADDIPVNLVTWSDNLVC